MESFVDQKGDWSSRKISLFGVARSVISQLSVGQDLTRVGLPAVFFEPYSLLELAASRKLGFFHELSDFSSKEDPIDKSIIVLRWFLSYISGEQPMKKPYNPVIGETHYCTTSGSFGNNNDEEGYDSEFIAEQVSHHPPVSAYTIINESKNIRVDANVSFGVKFLGNSVLCTTDGYVTISKMFNDDKKKTKKNNSDKIVDNIVFKISKGLPDVLINNVIFGTRTTGWTNSISIYCKEIELEIPINFHKKGKKISVSGSINLRNNTIYNFSGIWGVDKLYLEPTELTSSIHETNQKSKRILLFNPNNIAKAEIKYPSDESMVPDLNTLKLWKRVSQGIVNNDMDIANKEKCKIEANQRLRIQTFNDDDLLLYTKKGDQWILDEDKLQLYREMYL